MIKTILMFVCYVLIVQVAYAETCPSVNDIKQKLPHGWAFFDSEDGKLLSKTRSAQFKQNVKQFALAEWQGDSKVGSGMIHCYYRDLNGSDLEVYVAKANYIPNNAKNFWYQVSGYMHCAAGASRCPFSVGHINAGKTVASRG